MKEQVEPPAPFDPETKEDAAGTVGRDVSRGALVSFASVLGLRAASFAVGICLAHLLTPSDFGRFAAAISALLLMESFNELGVSLAVVRWDRDPREYAPTVMTISLATSGLIYGGAWLVAPSYCQLMGISDATGMMRLMWLAVLVDGLAVVPAGLLNRYFCQGRRLLADLASFTASTATSVTLALNGYGAWSFAWSQIVGVLVAVVFYLILVPVRIRPGWRPDQARALLQFGVPLAASSLLVLGVTNIDNIIVGAVLSPVALGLYAMAFNQSSWPLQIFSEPARRVALAGFSRMSGDKDVLARAMGKGLGLLLAGVLPTSAILFAYAEPLLRGVYGEKWAPAASSLRILTLFGLARILVLVLYDALVALDRKSSLLAANAVWLASLGPALLLGTKLKGIEGAAIAHVIIAALVVVPLFLHILHTSGISTRVIFGQCARPVFAAVLVLGTTGPVFLLVSSPLGRLFIGVGVAAIVCAPVIAPLRELLPPRSRRV